MSEVIGGVFLLDVSRGQTEDYKRSFCAEKLDV